MERGVSAAALWAVYPNWWDLEDCGQATFRPSYMNLVELSWKIDQNFPILIHPIIDALRPHIQFGDVLHWNRERYVLLRKGVVVVAANHDGQSL